MAGTVAKTIGIVATCVAVLALAAGTGCINELMIHPGMCRGGYVESTPGYVDIGTNGTRIAAFVFGPERGRKAILRCHGKELAGLAGGPKRLIAVQGADHNDLAQTMGEERYLQTMESFACDGPLR